MKIPAPAPLPHRTWKDVTPLEWGVLLRLDGEVSTQIIWNSPWEICLFSPISLYPYGLVDIFIDFGC